MAAAGLLAQELESLILDESNDDNLLEDFDFEIVEEDVSLSTAPCEVSIIQMNLKPRSLVSSAIHL